MRFKSELLTLALSAAFYTGSAHALPDDIHVVTVKHCNTTYCMETTTVYRENYLGQWEVVKTTTRTYQIALQPRD